MGGTAVLSVMVSNPVGEGLLNSIFPETEKVLFDPLQTVGFVVIASIEQKTTMLQLVTPEPLVCENVIIPDCWLKFVMRRI
jgi:hypothetical protein